MVNNTSNICIFQYVPNLYFSFTEKHPEIKKLMGCDPHLKYILTLMVLTQVISAYLLRDATWTAIFIVGYCWGGVINHSMTLAIHDISHNVVFGNGHPLANRLFGIFANLPIGVPISISFKKYHIDHHRFQGCDGKDVDLPTKIEGVLFHNAFTKIIWLLLNPAFYALRPLFVNPLPVSKLEILNAVVQIIFDVVILVTMGYRSLVYLIGGTVITMGLHPIAGHFIAEHYMFVKGYETYSYYGPLNMITFNVGYHNEHHDFPSIPGSRLPQVLAS